VAQPGLGQALFEGRPGARRGIAGRQQHIHQARRGFDFRFDIAAQ
jgi:hypothetical protein